jgi:hypothetical protein
MNKIVKKKCFFLGKQNEVFVQSLIELSRASKRTHVFIILSLVLTLSRNKEALYWALDLSLTLFRLDSCRESAEHLWFAFLVNEWRTDERTNEWMLAYSTSHCVILFNELNWTWKAAPKIAVFFDIHLQLCSFFKLSSILHWTWYPSPFHIY